MYQVFIKTATGYDRKKLIGEFSDYSDAYEKAEEELEKEPNTKYVIEEINGSVDSYGNLISMVVEEN